jgi:hypothetical protein
MVSNLDMNTPCRPRVAGSVALLTLLFSFPSRSQDGLQLFHKMQSALGGAEKIASIRDFEQTVRADTWDNDGNPREVVRKRVRFIRPSYLRIDQVGPDNTYVLYFDGTSGWEILPGGTLADLAGGELKFAQTYLSGLNLIFWLSDRDSSTVITSPAPNVIVVSTKADSSQTSEITLDPVTFLPIKQTGISYADPDHPVRQEVLLDRWEVSGGVKFPQRISNFHDGRKLAEITVEQTILDHGIKASDLAVKPPDVKPVMSGP